MATAKKSKKEKLNDLWKFTLDQGGCVGMALLNNAISKTSFSDFLKNNKEAIENLTGIEPETKEQLKQLLRLSDTQTTADLSPLLVLVLLRSLDACGLKGDFNLNDPPPEEDKSTKAEFCRLNIFGHKLSLMPLDSGIDDDQCAEKWKELVLILLGLYQSITIHVTKQAGSFVADIDKTQITDETLTDEMQNRQKTLQTLFKLNMNQCHEPSLQTESPNGSPPSVPPPQGEEEKYYATEGKKGLFVLMNDKNGRLGSEQDCDKLKNFFVETLQFDILEMDGSEKTDIIDFLANDVFPKLKKQNLEDQYYCLVFFIGCHGDRDEIIFSGKKVKFEMIQKKFNAESLDNYRGRPKVFLTQFCRGRNNEGGYNTDDSHIITSTILTGNDNADIFVIYSTVKDNVAYRHTDDGSIFVEKCVETLKRDWCHYHLEKMMLTVRKKIATWHPKDQKKDLIYRQTAVVETSLTKQLLFRKSVE